MSPDVPSRLTPIVGIGASAGGIDAFHLFFQHMPARPDMAFVVILHLPADRPSMLADILKRWTSMPVIDAADGCEILPGHVYVPQPGVAVQLRGGRLFSHRPEKGAAREMLPIDVFFDSLANEMGDDAVGVVLSGTGSDGALGLKAIKSRGGLTLAQQMDGGKAQHGGMAASAIAAGVVDIVATADQLPGLIHNALPLQGTQAAALETSPADLETTRMQICQTLQRQVGHDFSGYKQSTFLRRVQRRAQVRNCGSLETYAEQLDGDAAEVGMLFRDLLIGVTSFFRDPATFECLKTLVIPRLLEGRTADSTIRVWVPGCATGEEAYSLAILFCEQLDGLGRARPLVQIFATDIDESAVATARMGRYPSALLDEVAPERLQRYFVAGRSGSYTIGKSVREMCLFSVHSLTRDPPFSRMDLVSCRNLLIYLDNDLQGVVMPALHYALAPRGMLLLGSSESVAQHETLFATMDRKHRIFERRDTPTPPLRQTAKRSVALGQDTTKTGPPFENVMGRGAGRLFNRASARVLERFAPAFVVVTADGDIAQFSSRTGRFLEAAPGSPQQNVFSMCRQGLHVPLRDVLRQAATSGRLVERAARFVADSPQPLQRVTLTVEPLADGGAAPLFLVLFVEHAQNEDAPREPADGEGTHPDPNRQLERELREAHDQLRLLTEEHGTALEELTSANEELRSINEEFQSTNEELETSKEEIQSINEELQTVNAQLSAKLEELNDRNTDLQNLFVSTQVATIFLDAFLVVRSFTPAVASIYNLIPSDVGRPLSDIVSRLNYDGLREDVQHVMNTAQPFERRLACADGAVHYLMRMLPYRTPDSEVDGTVVTFVDVTSIVQAEQHQRLLVDELNHRVKNMLTVVISMATQTLRRAHSLEEFSVNYLGRVHALAGAYAVLANQSWQTVPLRELVLEQLRAFVATERDGHAEREGGLRLDGPDLMLEPRSALALGMALYELATNAVKYGAWSVPAGRVSIIWHLEQEPPASHLVLLWTEADGPPVEPPARRGFGMTLIERGLSQDMGAEVEVTFAPAGVRARLRAPFHGAAEVRP